MGTADCPWAVSSMATGAMRERVVQSSARRRIAAFRGRCRQRREDAAPGSDLSWQCDSAPAVSWSNPARSGRVSMGSGRKAQGSSWGRLAGCALGISICWRAACFQMDSYMPSVVCDRTDGARLAFPWAYRDRAPSQLGGQACAKPGGEKADVPELLGAACCVDARFPDGAVSSPL